MASADVTEEDWEGGVDETTALLKPTSNEPILSEPDDSGEAPSGKDDDKPLPRDQIILLCFARFIEPVAFFCIFPFINQMIWETGEVAETDVGFYSGLIVGFLYGAFRNSRHTDSNEGIPLLADTNVSDDSVGQSCRPNRKKTSIGWLTRWCGYRDSYLRPKQVNMADDCLSMFRGLICWNYCVGLSFVSSCAVDSGPLTASIGQSGP